MALPLAHRLSTASRGGRRTRLTGEQTFPGARQLPSEVPHAAHRFDVMSRSIWAKPFDKDLRRHIVKYFPSSYHGFDKKGQPVYIDRTGSAEIEKVLEVRLALHLRPLRDSLLSRLLPWSCTPTSSRHRPRLHRSEGFR